MAGAERLPGCAGGSCGTMGAVCTRFEPGLGQEPGGWFQWRKLQREHLGGYGTVFGAVLGENVQRDKWHHFGQSLATDCPSSYRFLSL